MAVFKRWNGTSWETIGPQISSARFDDTNHMIAPEYSSTSTYNVGDYVVQSDRLYKCISAIESAEEWIPAHWTQISMGGEVSDLNSALDNSNNELFYVSGYLNQHYIRGRQRYVNNGAETFANQSKWISPAPNEYIELKTGDIIVVHKSNYYHFRVCYSIDNKATWTMTSEQTTKFQMPVDAIGWISIITPNASATDNDIQTIINEHIIEIQRNNSNLLNNTTSITDGIKNALDINPNADFKIEAIKNDTTFIWVNTTATENGGTEKLIEIPVTQGDQFRIKFNFQAMLVPQNFNDYEIAIREIDNNETVLSSVFFHLSDTNIGDFTVKNANTKKIIANINLFRSNTIVSAGYYEEIKYSITLIKKLSDINKNINYLSKVITNHNKRLEILDGEIVTEWEIGLRYISNGQEAWTTISACMATKRGTYLNLKAGTVVALKNLQEYQFLIGYSTDGGTTWQGGSNREDPFTLANDCIAFITIRKKSGSFTEEEMNNVATNSIVILIPDSDVTGVNTQIIDGISIGNANFGAFELKASEHGIATQWISAGLTNYNSDTKYCDDISASKGDVLLISAEESVSYPSLFTSIGLAVYELNSSGTSVYNTSLTDISSPIKYTVQNTNTTKLRIYGNLKAESTSITTGYREIFEYKLNVLKQLSASGIDEILTEAGDTWEV